MTETEIRESIAQEFDAMAALLTEAMRWTSNPATLALLRDRRAQMATAAQIARGKVTP